jgi:hypothetical protein
VERGTVTPVVPDDPVRHHSRNTVVGRLLSRLPDKRAIDIRTLDRHPLASVGSLVIGLRCSWCPGNAPMPMLTGLHMRIISSSSGLKGRPCACRASQKDCSNPFSWDIYRAAAKQSTLALSKRPTNAKLSRKQPWNSSNARRS